MKKVFASIKQQTGFVVWGKSELLQKAGTVSASVQNMPLLSFLDLIMKDQPFNYRITDNTIFLYSKNDAAVAVVATSVAGRVTDSLAVPLIGATVSIVGGGRSAITDLQGTFTLPVNVGNVIRISFIGYQPKEITVTAAMLQAGTVGNVVLSAMSSSLTELNVTANTGYQNIPKERATGAFGVVTEATLNARMETNILERLEGTVPGLFMQNGAVNIRGLSTLYGTRSPLYVVDGFPYEGDLNYLNPADVVNVTVMKDAAATSIYGTRAANGVISITTRYGSSRKQTVNFSSTVFISPKPDADYMNLFDSKGMVELQQELFNIWHPSYSELLRRTGQHQALEALYQHEQGQITQAELDETLNRLKGQDGLKQVQDLYMRNRVRQRHAFSASGGNDIHQYNLAMNFTGANEYALKTGSSDVNVTLRDKMKVFKWLDAEVGAHTNIRKGSFIRETPDRLYFNMPYEILQNPDGSPAAYTKLKSAYEIERLKSVGLYDETFNHLQELDNQDLSYASNYFRLQGGFTARIIKGLSLDLKYQTERGAGLTKEYYNGNSYYVKNMINDAAQLINNELIKNVPDGGQLYENRYNSRSYTARAQLNFDRRFGMQHQVTALAGFEARAIQNKATTVFKMGYNDNNLVFSPVDEVALGNLKGTQSLGSDFMLQFNRYNNFTEEEDRYISAYANAGYTYNGKYNVTGSVRVDNSNLFGTDPRYRYLPVWSVGGSWRLTEEDFMKDVTWLSNLTIRSTYGLGGTVARTVGPYLQARTTFFSEAEAAATDIILPPNKLLRWEKTATTNIGIDFGFLKNRISGSLDYYIRKTSDLLGEKMIDPTNAFPSALINYGSLNNKGVELSLNTANIVDKNFNWSSTLSLSFNKNKMTEINIKDANIYVLTQGYGVNRIGYPMDAVFSFKYGGLDPTNGSVMVYDAKGTLVKNYDQNGNIVANMTDINALEYSGTLRPKYTAGFTNSFSYRQFSLNVMLIGNGGNVIRDVVPAISNNFPPRNTDRRSANFWRQPGDEKIPGMMPAPDIKGNGGTYYTLLHYAGNNNVLKGDYIKVRDIALGYNFAPLLPGQKKLQNAKLTLQVQNPFAWFRNDAGIDPEAYYHAGQYAERLLPVTRVFMTGIDITF
ncbi:SusC/RagA family TonB-linked outer membrane protein [Chitinophaga horti]|uniref:SusC/RagA family TonB-linked outer membrane protein n=1 Tax=Chitinophaga horti TaxID=2920382 RepID=A0ABY6IZD7_9BACT|nr:SusC/RagA family TonB-linked outer membrane protein [Chitinophaga horti]UYQ91439.1 SusC/RagA family TonB-linked outer membrane protein [Chitinophaga horti]